MSKFLIILVIYIYIMYYNYQKIKDNDIDMIRYRDSIARFTFIQFAFGIYDACIGKFDIITFIYRLMFSHIGVSSYSFIKEYVEQLKVV